jgi:hypothetical protein
LTSSLVGVKHFVNAEISAFLRAVDRRLKAPFRLEMIGGAVALLCFKTKSGTLEIDTTHGIGKIESACEAARKETGLDIPVQAVSIYDAPCEYESRLTRLAQPKLSRLHIHVPEKHDWALMKIVRLNSKDIEDITEVSDSVGFSKDICLKRFLSEMTHVIGRPSELVLSFVVMMEKLYGKPEADRMETVIKNDRNWSALLRNK